MADVTPWRGELTFVLAAGSLKEATLMVMRMQDALEGNGLHVQSGSLGPMRDEDVVPGSPLAKELQ